MAQLFYNLSRPGCIRQQTIGSHVICWLARILVASLSMASVMPVSAQTLKARLIYNAQHKNFVDMRDARAAVVAWHQIADEGFWRYVWKDTFPEPGSSDWTYNGVPRYWWVGYEYIDKPGELHGMDEISLAGECPAGFLLVDSPSNVNVPVRTLTCYRPEAVPCPCEIGNPILPATGIKQQVEVDYQGTGSNQLIFTRTYRSDRNGWSNNHHMVATDFTVTSPSSDHASMCYPGIGTATGVPYCFPYATPVDDRTMQPLPSRFAVLRGNDRALYFGTASDLKPLADINDRVSRMTDASGNTTAWSVYNAKHDATELYDPAGRILSTTMRNGQVTKYMYSDAATPPTIAPRAGLLIRVTDAFANQLNFTYDSQGRMATMTDPTHGAYTYAYDEASSIVLPATPAPGNLTSVTYPDGRKRVYWYNEQTNTAGANLPFALTGVTDENGVRFATYKYDTSGTAVSTEHAGGVKKYAVSYPYANQEAAVTDPLGTTRHYYFRSILGVIRSTGVTRWAVNGSPTASTSVLHDDNGNVVREVALNGKVTTYAYNQLRNLETKRVEAFGTPEAKTITTSWHATYRLPMKVVEPLKVTNFRYDARGNLLEKSLQATKDATGAQGMAAAVTGPIRSWKYTYNTAGQMLTSINPANAITTYTYDGKGNLETVRNALDQVTTLSNYDANGRVGRITDPNKVVEDLSYTPRGWLETRTVNGKQWRYSYDGVGQMKSVLLPDNTDISYTYDGAHRLISVIDSLGNSITYTLDNMGNRIAEEVKDPTGVLTRKLTRDFDVLNQLKQQTGGTL